MCAFPSRSSSRASDGIGPEAARFSLRDNLRAVFPCAGNRISLRSTRLKHRQEPSRVCDVVMSFRVRFVFVHGDQETMGRGVCAEKVFPKTEKELPRIA